MDAGLAITGGGVGQLVAGNSIFTAKYHRHRQNGRMKNLLACFIFLAVASSTRAESTNNGGWSVALPGYQITLPADHYPHYQYRTEWWYFTGNVQTADWQGVWISAYIFPLSGTDRRALGTDSLPDSS